MSDPELV